MMGWIQTIKTRIEAAGSRAVLTAGAFILIAIAIAFVFGFLGPNKSDLRGSLPADSLAYIRIRDVGSVYRLIAQNASIERIIEDRFPAGMEIAIAIKGFDTSEEAVTEKSAVLNLRPKFAAVVETNAWSWQTAGFIDGPLSEFVIAEYGKEATPVVQAGKFGQLRSWTAKDGRKSYAAAEGSRIYFGNDLEAVESCRSAANGLSPSLLTDADFKRIGNENTEAEIVGYFPRRAIEAFADVAGVSAAVSGSEQEGVRSFIARLVPQLLRNSVEEILWTSRIGEGYFEDNLEFTTRNSVSEVFAETMEPKSGDWNGLVEFIPKDTDSLTRYSLRNPRIAYRSLLFLAAKNSDPVSGKLIAAFSDSMLQPYGVVDAEAFLDAVGPELLTVQTSQSDDASAAIIEIKDREAVLKAIAGTIGTQKEPESKDGAEVWVSPDESTAAAIWKNTLVIGDSEVVISSITRSGRNSEIARHRMFRLLNKNVNPATTIRLSDNASGIVETMGGTKAVKEDFYLSETSFTKTGIVRRYESRFGLIGSVLSGFGE